MRQGWSFLGFQYLMDYAQWNGVALLYLNRTFYFRNVNVWGGIVVVHYKAECIILLQCCQVTRGREQLLSPCWGGHAVVFPPPGFTDRTGRAGRAGRAGSTHETGSLFTALIITEYCLHTRSLTRSFTGFINQIESASKFEASSQILLQRPSYKCYKKFLTKKKIQTSEHFLCIFGNPNCFEVTYPPLAVYRNSQEGQKAVSHTLLPAAVILVTLVIRVCATYCSFHVCLVQLNACILLV